MNNYLWEVVMQCTYCYCFANRVWQIWTKSVCMVFVWFTTSWCTHSKIVPKRGEPISVCLIKVQICWRLLVYILFLGSLLTSQLNHINFFWISLVEKKKKKLPQSIIINASRSIYEKINQTGSSANVIEIFKISTVSAN